VAHLYLPNVKPDLRLVDYLSSLGTQVKDAQSQSVKESVNASHSRMWHNRPTASTKSYCLVTTCA